MVGRSKAANESWPGKVRRPDQPFILTSFCSFSPGQGCIQLCWNANTRTILRTVQCVKLPAIHLTRELNPTLECQESLSLPYSPNMVSSVSIHVQAWVPWYSLQMSEHKRGREGQHYLSGSRGKEVCPDEEGIRLLQ